MLQRQIQEDILKTLETLRKIIIIFGPRQVGKTTLVHEVLMNYPEKILEINADRQINLEALSSRNFEKLNGLISGYDLLFIDEAQRIPDIGINLKILYDSFPALKIIVTGSSSLELANRIKESLAGRTWTYRLYPISVNEWKFYSGNNNYEMGIKLEDWLRFGMYPEIFKFENYKDKQKYLEELISTYLFKDILALASIRYPEKLQQLLKLLAYQIGNPVSTNEISNALQINRDTVTNYIDLLEKTFVIFSLRGFSRNLRKEVVKMNKIYFYDLGIRNALIENFNPLEYRQDTGALWENFLIVERRKKIEYQRMYGSSYFWRTYSGAELDYVEERDGRLLGFEFKWKTIKAKAPATWLATYDNASYQLINRDNFLEFIL